MRLTKTTLTPARLNTPWSEGLDQVLLAAPEIPIDDHSKIILFSDTHRGDKSAADPFTPNEGLFLHALTHYYQQGFTYIELGDGDDLWQSPNFSDIQHAYPQIFELLGRFQQDCRLHLILGNHELAGRPGQPWKKGELITEESLGLRYRPTRQLWLVAHGHQADPWCSPVNNLRQRVGQVVYNLVQLLQSGQPAGYLSRLGPINQAIVCRLEQWYRQWDKRQQKKLTQQLAHWACHNRQAVICGHTHLPFFPASPQIPYFNTGCGFNPGYLTGLEIQHGWIGLVQWWVNGRGTYQKRFLDAPCPLGVFG